MLKIKNLLLLTVSVVTLSSANVAFASNKINTDNFKLSSLNHNEAHNWEMANGKFLVQKLNNKKITYQNKATGIYYKIYQDAINNWNDLGVIKLVPTNKNAQIVLKGSYDSQSSKSYDGITDFSTNISTLRNKKINYTYLADTTVKLPGKITEENNPNLYIYTMIVAEHEIGHALGFDHDNSTDANNHMHVMGTNYGAEDVGAIYKLGDYEKESLLKYYAPQLK